MERGGRHWDTERRGWAKAQIICNTEGKWWVGEKGRAQEVERVLCAMIHEQRERECTATRQALCAQTVYLAAVFVAVVEVVRWCGLRVTLGRGGEREGRRCGGAGEMRELWASRLGKCGFARGPRNRSLNETATPSTLSHQLFAIFTNPLFLHFFLLH